MVKIMQAPVVILVRPQMGENIGAVARAMSNFGLSELRIAAPRDGWPNDKALEMAAGAEGIIRNAKIYPDFGAAMEGVQLAYATTARPRDMQKRVLEPAGAGEEMTHKQAAGLQCAYVFGPERAGLTNDDISLCDSLITIPTAPENSSLNIAQSSVLVGYEWFKAANQTSGVVLKDLPMPAPKEDWLGLFGQLEGYLEAGNFFKAEGKKPIMLQNLQSMLMRAGWNEQEVRSMRGVLRCLWEGNKG